MLSEGTYGVLSQEAGVGPRWGRQLGQDYGDKKIPRAPCSRKLWPLGVVVTPGWLWDCLPGRAGRQLGFSVGQFSGQRPAKGPAASGSSGHNSQVVGGAGVAGGRSGVSSNSTTASFPPEGWRSFSGNTCGCWGGECPAGIGDLDTWHRQCSRNGQRLPPSSTNTYLTSAISGVGLMLEAEGLETTRPSFLPCASQTCVRVCTLAQAPAQDGRTRWSPVSAH